MNNQFKKSIKKKKYLLLSLVVLLVIGILAFSLLRGRANVLLDEDTESNKTRIFSSYEEYNGSIIKLFVDKDVSTFFDMDDNEIYVAKTNVDYFRILDEDNVVYVSSSLNESTNRFVSDVVAVNIKTKEEVNLTSGEDLFLEVSDGSVYIINGLKGNVLYGKVDDLQEFSLNSPVSKVSSSRGKIFAINHTAINNVVRSTIYCVNDNTIETIVCPGKVQSVSVDYNNDNIIYYASQNLNNSINTTDSNSIVVFKKYLVDLSASASEPEAIYTLNSNVISIKDNYFSVDKETNSLYLLAGNFTKLKKVASLHENGLSSLIKVSTSGENIYFIDKNGVLKKI